MPADLAIDATRPLVIVDVDEVLALFVQGFERYLAENGYEMRLEKFALFSNIFEPGATEHLEVATGKALFDAFFAGGHELIPPAPGAAEALAALSGQASVVVLTNAPGHAAEERGRWLERHGMAYPMMINDGRKGPAIAALAARTSGPAAFVDDILYHLDSCAEAAPSVRRFQTVADERLRPLAPTSPDHPRVDGWPQLRAAIEGALFA